MCVCGGGGGGGVYITELFSTELFYSHPVHALIECFITCLCQVLILVTLFSQQAYAEVSHLPCIESSRILSSQASLGVWTVKTLSTLHD